MEKQKDFKIFSGFVLKIMAIVFMTIDHIGVFMYKYENLGEIPTIFRILGRLSFPIIIFLLVEGIRHTKNIKKYLLRLSLLALVFLLGQLFYFFLISNNTTDILSPAIDLLLTALALYFIQRKDKWSFLCLLPIAWTILNLSIKICNQRIQIHF